MPILIAPVNTDMRVVKILADERTKKHLEDLGLTLNSTLSVLSHSGGSVICVIKQGRLALDRILAAKIFVS